MKVVQNHLKREKNSKFFFPYFSVITEKNFEKFFKFFFEMKNYFSSFFHVSDNSEQLSKNSKNFQKKNFENFVKFFSFIIEKNEEKKFSSFFHVSDDSEQLLKNFQKNFFLGGGHQGAIFFFRFLAVSGHSELIRYFS